MLDEAQANPTLSHENYEDEVEVFYDVPEKFNPF
jgi:hypothetical protein